MDDRVRWPLFFSPCGTGSVYSFFRNMHLHAENFIVPLSKAAWNPSGNLRIAPHETMILIQASPVDMPDLTARQEYTALKFV